jgi:hypothetical protein
MSTHSDGPQKSLTAQELDAWLLAAKQKRLALHVQATGPWNGLSRQEAFAEMSCLLEEAFEEVRVVSESLREGSRVVRGESADLRTHSAQLMERGATLMERMSQFAPPSPEAVQRAESQMLTIFKNRQRPAAQ